MPIGDARICSQHLDYLGRLAVQLEGNRIRSSKGLGPRKSPKYFAFAVKDGHAKHLLAGHRRPLAKLCPQHGRPFFHLLRSKREFRTFFFCFHTERSEGPLPCPCSPGSGSLFLLFRILKPPKFSAIGPWIPVGAHARSR